MIQVRLWITVILLGAQWGMAQHMFPLKLDEAIALALEHNLDIAIQRESIRSAEAGVTEAQGAFDPAFNAGVTRNEDTRSLNAERSAAAAGLTRVRTESQSANVGVGGLTTASTRYNVNVQNRNSSDTFNNFEEEHTSSGGLTLTQPLLRGRGHEYVTYGLRLARRNVDISHLDFQSQVEGILLQVEQAYWDLIRDAETLMVRMKSVSAAQSILDQVEIKVDLGTAAEAERVQAQSGLAQRQVSLVAARRARSLQDRNLKSLILEDLTIQTPAFAPMDVPSTNRTPSAHQEVLKAALSNRPEILKIELELQSAREQLERTKNEALPQVDLEGNYGFNGLGGSFGDSVDHAASQDDRNWSLGLVYRKAWPDHQRIGSLRRQESALRSQALQARQTQRRIILEVDALYDRINGALDEMRAGELALKYAELNLDNERAKFEVQKSTVHNLLLLETELLESELSQVRARAEYQKILAELDRAKGALLERWGIELE